MRRRRFVAAGAAAFVGLPAFAAGLAGGSSEPRFSLGIASGQPHPSGMVLWTRLTGAGLGERVPVGWEIADDEGFTRVVARGLEDAEAAWGHSVHAEPVDLAPDRWYWYRFTALGQQSEVGRTRTAPAADAAVASLRFAIASCQRYDVNHYAAWRHVAGADLDLVLFLGDYIYESAQVRDAIRPMPGGLAVTLEQYRARYALYKSDPLLRAAHAAAPWLLIWDDHEVANDYANLQAVDLGADMKARRTAAYRAYWEHMPFPKSLRPVGPDMRIVGRTDWGTLARIHRVDDRQYRDVQACPKPGRGGSNTVRLAECAELLDPKRSLLGAEQEQWLADGWDPARPWNLLMQQSLMARFSWSDTANGAATYWTDGWDGYAASRRRLLATAAARKVTGLVVVGGDVHSHYVADLKVDFDDAASPVVASEFCGSSISSLSVAQSRVDAALPFNPHLRYGRSDQRGTMTFELKRDALTVAIQAVDRPADPASGVTTVARFVVDPARPGPVAA